MAVLNGRLTEAERWAEEGWRLEVARGTPPTVFSKPLGEAEFDIWFRGKREEGVRKLNATLARHPLQSVEASRRPYFWAANLYAYAGRPDLARNIIAQFRADVTDSTIVRENESALRRVQAEIAMAERRPLDALQEFRLADQRPDGPAGGCTICPLASYGRAFDLANQPDSAIVMFERYISTPLEYRWEYEFDGILLAPILKRLGELYEQTGQPQKAIPHYERFLTLWKDADPDLQPKVTEVRQRLARIRAGEAAKR
jgi:tetratricopeptide (TPR) repeat protein